MFTNFFVAVAQKFPNRLLAQTSYSRTKTAMHFKKLEDYYPQEEECCIFNKLDLEKLVFLVPLRLSVIN